MPPIKEVKTGICKYCLPVGLLLCLLQPAAADERSDFVVNDDAGQASQSHPRIALLGNEGFVVTWVDRRNGVADIYLQRFDSDGNTLGYNVKVNDDTESYQFEPAIAGKLSGEFSVVWKDYRHSGYPFDPEIFCQRFDATAQPVGSNSNLTVELPDSTKESPDIALAEWGRGVVVWADYRNRNWDIYGQLIASDGSLIGSNFLVNDDASASQQHAPRVAVSRDGWFVVAWYDNRHGDDDIFFQRFDSLANRIGVNVQVNADSHGARQAFPDVATDAAGHFTVVWVDWRNGTYPQNPDIYSRKYDTLLVPVTPETMVNTDGGVTAQREPAIAADNMGNVAIIWADSTSTSWDISGQMVDVDGVVREANFRANNYADGSQLSPDVALDGAYRYITWADNRDGNWNIYAAIGKYNELALSTQPSALNFEMFRGEQLPPEAQLVIDHSGYNPIDFALACSADWFAATPSTGTTPAAAGVSVVTNDLAAGTYHGTVTVTDNLGNASPTECSVTLEVTELIGLAGDTLSLASTVVEPGGSGSIACRSVLVTEADHISLPLQFDAAALTVDSVVPEPSLPVGMDFSATIDGLEGWLFIELDGGEPGVSFEAGTSILGNIYFTAKEVIITTVIDTFSNGTLRPLVGAGLVAADPAFEAGYIAISPATGVEPIDLDNLPNDIGLDQNRPNPFNLSTIIEYQLPHTSNVLLEVYNVVGQRVRVLVSGRQAAGRYRAYWNGCLGDGRAASTGVYFYRLQTDSTRFVRKMILVK